MLRIPRKKILAFAEKAQFSGLVSVWKDQKCHYEFIAGERDRATHDPIRRDTLFGIASGTKTFTALAIGKLIDRGLLRLDSKVKEVMDLGLGYDDRVTIHHLLSHTSGIPDYFDEEQFNDVDNVVLAVPNENLITPLDYLPLFPRRAMDFQPGETFKYNNGGFVYLAMIVAKVSGRSYQDFINEEILKPIGILRGGVHHYDRLPPNTGIGYTEPEGSGTNYRKIPIQAGGDGGIFVTVDEVRMMWEAFYAGKIVSPALVAEFVRPQVLVRADRNLYYGLGMWLKKKTGYCIPHMIGGDSGIDFMSSFNPVEKVFRCILSNVTDGAVGMDDFIFVNP